MTVSACAVKCKLINDKECCWSGCLLKLNNKICAVTTIASVAFMLPCKFLNFALAQRFRNLSSFLLDVSICVQHDVKSEALVSYCGTPVAAWKSYRLANSLREVKFSSDLLANENQSVLADNPRCCSAHEDDGLLSWFVLFEVDNWGNHEVIIPKINEINQGMTIWTYSFPFGDTENAVFYNCASKGIVSNIINRTFLLIDACCLPGSQGAGVFTTNSNLIGIIICPLELKTGQLAGLTVVCAWSEVQKSLAEQTSANKSIGFSALVSNVLRKNDDFTNASCQAEVVCLRHSWGWGSGVVVAIDTSCSSSKFYVVTCRHVVAPARNELVQTDLFCGSKFYTSLSGKVLYTTAKDTWLDFAVLEVPCSNVLAVKLYDKMKPCLVKNGSISLLKHEANYNIGTSVFAKGHCLFGNGATMPTVTKGIISNVIYVQRYKNLIGHNPILLHSNCTILNGASGGGLFCSSRWYFYGLIVNNVKQLFNDDQHVLYQKINFILPASVFMPSVGSYILRKKDFSVLNILTADDQLKKQWFLEQDQSSSFTTSKL